MDRARAAGRAGPPLRRTAATRGLGARPAGRRRSSSPTRSTSALDVSIRGPCRTSRARLQRAGNLSILFISQQPGRGARRGDDIAVMYWAAPSSMERWWRSLIRNILHAVDRRAAIPGGKPWPGLGTIEVLGGRRPARRAILPPLSTRAVPWDRLTDPVARPAAHRAHLRSSPACCPPLRPARPDPPRQSIGAQREPRPGYRRPGRPGPATAPAPRPTGATPPMPIRAPGRGLTGNSA